MTDEQKELLERSGAKNDWIVGLVFLFIFLAVVGINIFCRYNDNRKLERMECVQGFVTSRQDYEKWTGRKRHVSDSIIVEYTPQGSERTLSFRDSDGPYEFIRKGDTLNVYYEKEKPEEAFIAKTDWLTGKDVRADINYEVALIISIFPLGIAVFFFAEELSVRRKIKKGQFKLKKGDGLYPNEELHSLVRMSNGKRSWPVAIAGLSLFYIFCMVMGIAWIVVSTEKGEKGFLIGGIFVILLAQGVAVGIRFIVKYLSRKKKNFIEGFMSDDATMVYKDRRKAANVLWKHVRRFMEAEPLGSRYKYDYSKLWLEKYEDKLEKFLENRKDSER